MYTLFKGMGSLRNIFNGLQKYFAVERILLISINVGRGRATIVTDRLDGLE